MNRRTDPVGNIDAAGWAPAAAHVPSPNHDARPDGVEPRLVVIHAISLPPGEYGGDYVSRFFLNRLDPQVHPYFAGIAAHRVSAHFFMRRDGELLQFVSCLERAWHAGRSCWRGHERCNDFSIGIELEGDDLTPFTEAQYAALTGLLDWLCASYPIAEILGHADIAAGRKTDPGPFFDWRRVMRTA